MPDKSKQDWQSQADGLEVEGRAFINGQYRNALAGETRTTINPADGQEIADVASCGTRMRRLRSRGRRLKVVSGRLWRQLTERWYWFAGLN